MQEKYEQALASLAEMEKRMVMAESMLEATLQYQSGQLKAQPSPRCVVNFTSAKSFSYLCAVLVFLFTGFNPPPFLELYWVMFTLIYHWVCFGIC